MERNLARQGSQRRRGGLPRPYVAIWVVLSSMALTYLVMLSARPELADQIAALAGTDARASAVAQENIEGQLRADITSLNERLEAVQRELEAMRLQVAAREGRDQALEARLAAIEADRFAPQTSPLTTSSVDRREALPGRTADGRAVEPPQMADLPQRRPAVPKQSDRVAFGPPQVKPAATMNDGPKGVQIATGPSVDALRISWMLLAERHKEVLRDFEPRFVPSTSGSGPAYRLIVGPLENTSSANRVCSELRARRVTCGVSAFGGEPL